MPDKHKNDISYQNNACKHSDESQNNVLQLSTAQTASLNVAESTLLLNDENVSVVSSQNIRTDTNKESVHINTDTLNACLVTQTISECLSAQAAETHTNISDTMPALSPEDKHNSSNTLIDDNILAGEYLDFAVKMIEQMSQNECVSEHSDPLNNDNSVLTNNTRAPDKDIQVIMQELNELQSCSVHHLEDERLKRKREQDTYLETSQCTEHKSEHTDSALAEHEYIPPQKKRRINLSVTKMPVCTITPEQARRNALAYMPVLTSCTCCEHDTDQSKRYVITRHIDTEDNITAQSSGASSSQQQENVGNITQEHIDMNSSLALKRIAPHSQSLTDDTQTFLRYEKAYNISLHVIELFSRCFSLTQTNCTYTPSEKCYACKFVADKRPICGDEVFEHLIKNNIRITQLCSPIAACMLLLEKYATKHTVAHDKYLRTAKTHILSATDMSALLAEVYNMSEYRGHFASARASTKIESLCIIHTYSSNLLRTRAHGIDKLFLHQFASYIVQQAVAQCVDEKDVAPTCLDSLLSDEHNSHETISASKEYIQQNIYEYAERITNIRASLVSDNRVVALVSKNPCLSSAFILFSTEEIFDMLTQNLRFIESSNFAHFIRRARVSASCARRARVAHLSQNNIKGENVMLALELFRFTSTDRSLKNNYTYPDIIVEQQKIYARKLHDIFIYMNNNNGIQLASTLISHINFFLSPSCVGHNKTAYKQKIKQLFQLIDDELKHSGFMPTETLSYRMTEYGSESYKLFSLHDVCDQAIIVDAIDSAITNTLHILRVPFCVARRLMLHVILNIWYFGGNDDDSGFVDIMSSYDKELILRFATILHDLQEVKINNLHRVLHYEQNYIETIESDCAVCAMLHAGHYGTQANICLSKACLNAAIGALFTLLPSSCECDNIVCMLNQGFFHINNLVKLITNKIINGRVVYVAPSRDSLLNIKLCEISTSVT